jgi:regulatory protein
MKITQLKQQIKDTERVSIFVDEKYSFSLTLDQVLQEKLKKGVDIDVEQLEHFKKLSGEGKLRSRALEWLMGRPHSERELRDYLYRKKAEKEQVEVLVTEFLSKNYLNDENFARWFAEGRLRKNKSERAIKAELMSKGVSPVTIQSVVAQLSDGSRSNDKEALARLVNKLRNRTRYQDTQKLTGYLITKGFSYSEVKEAIQSRED